MTETSQAIALNSCKEPFRPPSAKTLSTIPADYVFVILNFGHLDLFEICYLVLGI
jgi:hypothetical protein